MSDAYAPANVGDEFADVPVPGAINRLSSDAVLTAVMDHAYITGGEDSLDEGLIMACIMGMQTYVPAAHGLHETYMAMGYTRNWFPRHALSYAGFVAAYYSSYDWRSRRQTLVDRFNAIGPAEKVAFAHALSAVYTYGMKQGFTLNGVGITMFSVLESSVAVGGDARYLRDNVVSERRRGLAVDDNGSNAPAVVLDAARALNRLVGAEASLIVLDLMCASKNHRNQAANRFGFNTRMGVSANRHEGNQGLPFGEHGVCLAPFMLMLPAYEYFTEGTKLNLSQVVETTSGVVEKPQPFDL